MVQLHKIASEYLAAGLSVIPLRLDGSKAPAGKWEVYQTRPATPEELAGWFPNDRAHGIGIVQGAVSGNLEMLEFETQEVLGRWEAVVRDHGREDLLQLLNLRVRSGGGGIHFYYRCPDGIEGNQKLARFADGKVSIETRGEGGQVVAPGSPREVHATRNPYKLLSGSFRAVPVLSALDREFAFAMARSCNQHTPTTKKWEPVGASSSTTATSSGTPGERPGDIYNARVTQTELLALLERHEWQLSGGRGEVCELLRPGKREGSSATLGYVARNVLYVFSSNAAPFEAETSYDPFAVYCLLEHGGDFVVAGKALFDSGYKAPLPPKIPLRIPGARPQEKESDAERAIEELAQAVERPEVDIAGRQDREITQDAWTAFLAAQRERPLFFAKDRGICLLTRDLEGNPYTQYATPETMAHALRLVADWVRVTPATTRKPAITLPARFPTWVAGDMLSDPTAASKLPRLRGVVSCPVVTRAGKLLATPGYDSESELFLSCPLVVIPGTATQEEAQSALAALFEVFEEFPYATEADRANAIALLLTPFLRHLISGPVPLAVVEAPAPGTGKSLLARSLLAVSTPGRIITDGPSERERGAAEEWAKHLGALLASSPAAVLLDNLRGMIASGTLEAFLTNPKDMSVRILGKSEMQSIDASGVTMAMTGNNALFQHDMIRRSYSIRLDAGVERPETRTGFRVRDLDSYVRDHRAELLGHVVVILSAWIAAGAPEGKGQKGSFERWAGILSGVLEFCGVTEFLGNDAERAESSDPETANWRAFFAAWWETFGDRLVSAKQLLQNTEENENGRTEYSPGLAVEHEIVTAPSSSKAVSKRLQAFRGRVFSGFRLEAVTDAHKKTLLYRLQSADSAGIAGIAGFNSSTRGRKDKSEEAENTLFTQRDVQTKPAIPAIPASVKSGEGERVPAQVGATLPEQPEGALGTNFSEEDLDLTDLDDPFADEDDTP